MPYTNINDAFLFSLRNIDECGKWLKIRGSNVKEITDYSFTIENPIQRVLSCKKRYNNILATVAETLWVLAGKNDMWFLTKFLPNATDYSDGVQPIWGGAYGPRLRFNHPTSNRNSLFSSKREHTFYPKLKYYDQIKSVIETLKEDPYSRQAIIMIGQASDYNYELTTKDRPCTMFVQFLIRNNRLHCYVKMRSNDCIWGCFNINVFEWTILQEIIASILNLKVGTYTHNAISFHYYENMQKRVENILSANQYDIYHDLGEYENFKYGDLNLLYTSIDKAMYLINKPFNSLTYPEDRDNINLPSYFIDLPMTQLLINEKLFSIAFNLLTNHFININKSSVITDNDMYYIAALEYLFRQMKKLEFDNKEKTLELFETALPTHLSENCIKFITGKD